MIKRSDDCQTAKRGRSRGWVRVRFSFDYYRLVRYSVSPTKVMLSPLADGWSWISFAATKPGVSPFKERRSSGS